MNPSPATTIDVGVELVDAHRVALTHVRACGHSVPGQAPHPTRRLERPVGRVVDRTEVETVERRSELVDPLDGEPVLAQRVVLSPQGASRSVSSKASRRLPTRRNASPASSSRRSSDRSVSSMTSLARSVAQEATRLVVGRRRTAQRETAVAAAGSARDLTRLVQAHAHPALRRA